MNDGCEGGRLSEESLTLAVQIHAVNKDKAPHRSPPGNVNIFDQRASTSPTLSMLC